MDFILEFGFIMGLYTAWQQTKQHRPRKSEERAMKLLDKLCIDVSSNYVLASVKLSASGIKQNMWLKAYGYENDHMTNATQTLLSITVHDMRKTLC